MNADLLKDRYYGSLAATYDRERLNTPLWNREQAAVERFLSEFAPGVSVLDAPIGTGRFLSTYHDRGMAVTGLDASTEMLGQSEAKADHLGLPVTLRQGDLRRLPFADGSFDLGVSVRFLNWVSGADLTACISELSRVANGSLLLGIRSYAPLSEINLGRLESVKHHLLQVKLRFYQARTRAQFVYHERSTVDGLFSENNLKVVDRVRIPIKMAGEYFIYRLTRQ